MGGADKNARAALGRSMLEWSVRAMAARTLRRARSGRHAAGPRGASSKLSDAMRDVQVVAGGERRSDSVRNGVAATARRSCSFTMPRGRSRHRRWPMPSPRRRRNMAPRCRSCLSSTRSSAPAAAMLGESVDRAGLVRTQTPQGARRELLLDAIRGRGLRALHRRSGAAREPRHRGRHRPGRGDEPQGHRARGSRNRARDRRCARGSVARPRVGLGQDSHGFGPDLGLRLGGIDDRDAPRLYGHSDGDVVLHAARDGSPRPPPGKATLAGSSRRRIRGRPALPAPTSCARPSTKASAGGLGGRIGAGVVGRCPAQARRPSGSTPWRERVAQLLASIATRWPSPRRPATSTATRARAASSAPPAWLPLHRR